MNPVYVQVPMPFYEEDAELNAMSMLVYVIENQRDVLDCNERRRIVQWLASRYGAEVQP